MCFQTDSALIIDDSTAPAPAPAPAPYSIPFGVKAGDMIELTQEVDGAPAGTLVKVIETDAWHETEHVYVALPVAMRSPTWLTDDQFKLSASQPDPVVIDPNVGPDADGYSLVAFDSSTPQNADFLEVAADDPLYTGDQSMIQSLALNGDALDVHMIKGYKASSKDPTIVATTYGVYKVSDGIVFRFNVIDSDTIVPKPPSLDGQKRFACLLLFQNDVIDFTTHDTLVAAVRHASSYALPENLAIVKLLATMTGGVIG